MKTTNKRRPYLEIPRDEIDALPPELRSIFTTLNERLKVLSELHESTAGLRGPVGIAKQAGKDLRGVDMPGLTLEGNRAANAADPIDEQDLVTLGYLKRLLTCKNITRILEGCDDEGIFDDELESESACSPIGISNKKATNTGLTNIHAVQVLNEFIYVLGDDLSDGRLQVYRRGELDPVLIADLTLTEISQRMALQGRYLYVCRNNSASENLTLIDVGRPDAPVEVSITDMGAATRHVSVEGRYAFVACDSVIKIVDVSVPAVPVVAGTFT
ncbi:MAG: hypothetical protein WBV94_09090 [Blastocatellia bacterium]